eukprot:5150045-Amphidinium_carterae.3
MPCSFAAFDSADMLLLDLPDEDLLCPGEFDLLLLLSPLPLFLEKLLLDVFPLPPPFGVPLPLPFLLPFEPLLPLLMLRLRGDCDCCLAGAVFLGDWADGCWSATERNCALRL